MIYINSDPHGNYSKIKDFCKRFNTTTDDIMILLGDIAFNFADENYDEPRRKWLTSLPCTFFCIHGNHDKRPYNVDKYHLIDYKGGKVWYTDEYPNVMFAKDGEIFDFDGKKCIVIGGAYSVDKEYRLLRNWTWHADEQPDDEVKQYVKSKLSDVDWKVDCVFSHTCPLKYEPIEAFLDHIDQSKVDKSTEIFLDEIEDKLEYGKWYCGHYHIDKSIDKIRFIFNDFIELE